MKVFILVEGSQQLGFGHVTRCLAIAQAFEDRNIKCKMIVHGDAIVEDLIKSNDYQLLQWHDDQTEILNMVDGADLVIIDSYIASLEFYQKVSNRVKKAAFIDDYQRMDYPKGTVINGSLYGQRMDYPALEGVEYLVGPHYIPLRKKFWDVPQKEIKPEINDVLITFGGMKHSDIMAALSEKLEGEFGFRCTVIDPNMRKVDVHAMMDLMLRTDLCISGGGQTTFELARMGVPTIGICFAENQRQNLESMVASGFMESAGWWEEEILFDRIIEKILMLKEQDKRRRRRTIGRNLIDGQGARHIAAALFEHGWRLIEN